MNGIGDQRSFLRIPFVNDVTLFDGPGTADMARTTDIGRGGLCLWTDSMVTPGAHVLVQFPGSLGTGQHALDGAAAAVEFMGQVVWSRPDFRTGGFEVGVRIYQDEEGAEVALSGLLRDAAIRAQWLAQTIYSGTMNEQNAGALALAAC
jgi:hypothetical protein